MLYKNLRFIVSSLHRGGFLALFATLRFKKEVIPSIVNLYREPPTTSTSESYRIVGLGEFSLEDFSCRQKALKAPISVEGPITTSVVMGFFLHFLKTF